MTKKILENEIQDDQGCNCHKYNHEPLNGCRLIWPILKQYLPCVTRVFLCLKCFGKLQAIHKENGNPFLGASENYVCKFLLLEWFIELQTLHNGNGKPFFMEIYKVYISLNCLMKQIFVQPNAYDSWTPFKWLWAILFVMRSWYLLFTSGCPCPSDTVKSPGSIFFPSFFYLLISFAFTSLTCSSLPVK